MSRYPHPELKDVPEDIRTKILEVQEKAGFVPNVFLALARRQRQREIFEHFPDATDLMLICMEAGLSMDAALALHLRRVGYDEASGIVHAPDALPHDEIQGCGGSCSVDVT